MDTQGLPITNGVGGARDFTRPSATSGTYLETIHSWIVTVDHKKLGILYICYALIFHVISGVDALLLRH